MYTITQGTRDTAVYHAEYAAPIRKHDELDHTDLESIYLPGMAGLDHELSWE